MDIEKLAWLGLILTLFISTFGTSFLILLLLAFGLFFLGCISLLYIKEGNVDEFDHKYSGNPMTSEIILEGGLMRVIKELTSPKRVQKSDNRVTGSELIDSSLQEILGYIIRDYISPWYNLISRDTEFSEIAIKKSAQTLAINISNKVKEIDWIPFLTTRLVDDAATHLRLFKQARARMKLTEKSKTPKGSPMRELKGSPKKCHKRNKSETDLNWYINKNVEKVDSDNSAKGIVQTLEDHFFDLECLIEKNQFCRDSICMSLENEKDFLIEIVEILLYILLPDADFKCKPLRFVLREIFSKSVILPLFALLSDPDYINQTIIWLCLRGATLPSEVFLTVLRLTDNCDELKSTKEIVLKEIQLLRSRDSGGESDLSVKQQLSSLYYVQKIIDNKLSKIQDFEENDSPNSIDYIQMESAKKISLSLNHILKNNIALSYFIDFVSTTGKQTDLFFYLNVEGWKVSVEQQLLDLHLNKMKGGDENPSNIYDTIRSTALSIYEQYLGDKAEQKVFVKQSIVQNLYFKIRNLNEVPSEAWFDDVQKAVYNKMENDENFMSGFKKSKAYIKMLQELDLLTQVVVEEDAISVNSQGSDGMEKVEKSEIYGEDKRVKTVKHTRSFSDVTIIKPDVRIDKFITKEEEQKEKENEEELKKGEYTLNVQIIETGIVCEKGKTFGIYALRVSRQFETGFLEEWHIYRRYSDFHDLYSKVKDKYPELGKLTFPGKKTFHNMDRSVLEKRMKLLGLYMNSVTNSHVLNKYSNLRELLMTFLEQGDYDRVTGGPISSTINTLVNPIKSGMKTIKNMPEQLISTVDEVVGGISKVFQPKADRLPEASKVGAGIEETDDNIPLRIMLLLMDEVFDLKSRNQWLRRRIVTLLRQIVRTMFGDIVNRRILDYVSFITSPKNVAHYLSVFKQAFWPNGMRSEKKSDRDEDTRNRTRIAAKTALLSCLSDELKHIIGSETTRRGLLTIFELFQRPILNRRLLYVLLEGVLCTLFPEKDIANIFKELHCKSKRINKNVYENCVR